ncbi:MAG: LysM peptidoglycan-binding domain-containing protein [Armatimonadetes bacterium]|nr:LysM peptidoglycan-binding domain-containing protein [Armatimonadota bacterium]
MAEEKVSAIDDQLTTLEARFSSIQALQQVTLSQLEQSAFAGVSTNVQASDLSQLSDLARNVAGEVEDLEGERESLQENRTPSANLPFGAQNPGGGFPSGLPTTASASAYPTNPAVPMLRQNQSPGQGIPGTPQATYNTAGATTPQVQNTPDSQPNKAVTPTQPAPSGKTPPKDPAPEGDTTNYKVQKGDTLSEIAQKYGTSVDKLMEVNKGHIKDKNLIYDGDTIAVFKKAGVPDDAPLKPGEKKMNVLVYLNGNNDLDKQMQERLKSMRRTGSDENTNILVQASSKEKGGEAKRYFVTSDGKLQEVQNLGKTDMGDKKTLSDFMTWSMKNYDARENMVIIAGHGAGPRGTSGDDFSGNRLTVPELGQAFDATKKATHDKVDIVAFDSCLMAHAEVADQLKGKADVMVASQELMKGLPVDKLANEVKESLKNMKNVDAKKVAKSMVEATKNSPGSIPTLSAIDLTRMPEVEKNLDRFSERLLQDYDKYNRIDDEELKKRARDLMASVEGAVIAKQSDDTMFQVGDSHGLSAFLPTDKVKPVGYENLEMSGKTRWDEFIDKVGNDVSANFQDYANRSKDGNVPFGRWHDGHWEPGKWDDGRWTPYVNVEGTWQQAGQWQDDGQWKPQVYWSQDGQGNWNPNLWAPGDKGWESYAWRPGDGWQSYAWRPEDGWQSYAWRPEGDWQSYAWRPGDGWQSYAWRPEDGWQSYAWRPGDGWQSYAWRPEDDWQSYAWRPGSDWQ